MPFSLLDDSRGRGEAEGSGIQSLEEVVARPCWNTIALILEKQFFSIFLE